MFGLSVGWESSSTFSAKVFLARRQNRDHEMNVTFIDRLYRTGPPAGGFE